MNNFLTIHALDAQSRTPDLVAQLTDVWEASVRATHDFLPEAEILRLKTMMPEVFASLPQLFVAENTPGEPLAFMGLSDAHLEALFVAPQARHQGIGRALLETAIQQYGVTTLAVNEQNPAARGFYEHMGFVVYKRTDTDEQGAPYPLLYMRRDAP